MSTQFVDINADGYNDILAGSFEGGPQIIMGTKEGYEEPKPVTNRDGDTVIIKDFWNFETKKWDESDRTGTEGHCTSASAVDWDADGDLDLLLGDYYGGRLFLCLNEGTAKEPQFATKNQPVKVGDEPIAIKGGLAAPRVVDWNQDGLFDILCGGSKGGVYYFQNTGDKASPKFAKVETLIPQVSDPTGSFIRRVPSRDGQPTLPGSSYHIEPCDYDGDGDLDLLIGGRSSWLQPKVKKLTKEEKARVAELREKQTELRKQLTEASKRLSKAKDKGESESEKEASAAYAKVSQEFGALLGELGKLSPPPSKSGDFVWFYRRK